MHFPQHFSSGGIPFFVNSAHDIIRKCIGTPSIAYNLARYPTVQDDAYMYILLLTMIVQNSCFSHDMFREMFHGKRWLEDQRFFSPMVSLAAGSVFIQDFVKFNMDSIVMIGHLLRFFYKVCVIHILCRVTGV